MLIGFNAAEDIYFIHSALFKFFVLSKTCNRNDLHGILFFVSVVDCPVDLAVNA